MKIRYGTYTVYADLEMKLIEYCGHGQDQMLENMHRLLVYPVDLGPLNGFVLDELSNNYKKDVLLTEIENAFFVMTKVIYKGYTFEVEPYVGEEKILHLRTTDTKLGEELKFYELHDGFGNPYFLGELSVSEVDRIWEERSKSDFDLPMPEHIDLVKEIPFTDGSW